MVMVGLPLAALMWEATSEGTQSFWDAVSSPEAVAALKLTLGASLAVSALNAVLGTVTAWVLVRDDFRGKTVVNAIIDLPFALTDDRRRPDLARALRADVTGRHRRRVLASRDRARDDVRDAAVRRPYRSAGAPGARSRARGGRALTRSVPPDDLPANRLPEHPSRGSSPGWPSPSPRPSASSDPS